VLKRENCFPKKKRFLFVYQAYVAAINHSCKEEKEEERSMQSIQRGIHHTKLLSLFNKHFCWREIQKKIAQMESSVNRQPKHFLANEIAEICNQPIKDEVISETHTRKGIKLKRLKKAETASLPAAIQTAIQKSDLVPGLYEGGFKLWECSIDLVDHLVDVSSSLKQLRILELGCGHGFPGIFALQNGAFVTFQDYNEEVLRNLTIFNVNLNCQANDCFKRAEFVSGDWALLKDQLKANSFDLILSADTIYHTRSYGSLLSLIDWCLKSGGEALIAAKSYYFSCGGGTRQLREALEQSLYASSLKFSVIKRYEDGVSNIRELLTLKKTK